MTAANSGISLMCNEVVELAERRRARLATGTMRASQREWSLSEALRNYRHTPCTLTLGRLWGEFIAA